MTTSHDWGRGAAVNDASSPFANLSMVDCVADDGSGRAVENGTLLYGVVSDCDALLDADSGSMEWTVTDDGSEEDEVSLTVSQFAGLLRKAQAWDRATRLCVHLPVCACE